jgi:cytochrome c oxidase subunit III
MTDEALGIQFSTAAQQRETAKLGMWAFLATEMLFFGSLIAAYFSYRIWFGEEFIAAARHTRVALGAINTAVLLTSSACMAMAVVSHEQRTKRPTLLWLAATGLLGVTFLGIKAWEYALEYREHLIPAVNFDGSRYGGITEIFFAFYFSATGLHALHLLIGIVLVAWLGVSTAGDRGAGDTQTRLIGLYWHFVDIVWIFLFPLIYLAGRNG